MRFNIVQVGAHLALLGAFIIVARQRGRVGVSGASPGAARSQTHLPVVTGSFGVTTARRRQGRAAEQITALRAFL